MSAYKIFISSPGDVGRERHLAEQVIRRVAAEFQNRVEVQPYFWEYEPMESTRDYQENIPLTSDFDLVICILWKRLGSPLSVKHQRPEGGQWRSGTEFELVTAVESKKARGAPDIFIFKNDTKPTFEADEAGEGAKTELDLAQWKALIAFVKEWCEGVQDGQRVFTAALNRYQALDQFEQVLEKLLLGKLNERFPPAPDPAGSERTGLRPAAPTWTEGSPFRGLEAFQFLHAAVFCGRTHAIGEVLDRLRRKAAHGRPFVLILGASGSGKSSLAMAGVLPLLVKPGTIEGIGLWRRVVFRPGGQTEVGDLFDRLAAALVRRQQEGEGLPELISGRTTVERLAADLRADPKAAALLVRSALDQVAVLYREAEAQKLRGWMAESQTENRMADVERYGRLLAELTPREARLALVIDQAEELFTADDLNRRPELRTGFAVALDALAASGFVFVLATLRSDFYSQIQQLPAFVDLKEADGQFDLLPAQPAEIAQMIRQPALAAGLRFEQDRQTQEGLDEVLAYQVEAEPRLLPLLEFALDELYKQRSAGGLLSFEAYRVHLDGSIVRALAKRADATLAGLPELSRDAFRSVMRRLATTVDDRAAGSAKGPLDVIQKGSIGPAFQRQRVPYDQLTAHPPGAKGLVDAFVAARLLVVETGKTDDQKAEVTVAHEALFQHWDALKNLLLAERDDLILPRARVAASYEHWRAENRSGDFLLPPGKQLSEAEQLLAEYGEELTPELKVYVAASMAQAHAQQRQRQRLLVGALVVFALLAIFGFWQRQVALAKADEALVERGKAEKALQVAQSRELATSATAQLSVDPELSVLLAIEAVKLSPTAEAEDALRQALLASHVRTVIREHTDTVNRTVFSPDGKLVVTASMDGTAGIWEAKTGAPVASVTDYRCCVENAAFSPDGNLLVTTSGAVELHTARLSAARTGKVLVELSGHADSVNDAAFSPDGKLVVTASNDKTALVFDADTHELVRRLGGHEYYVLHAGFSLDSRFVVTSTEKTVRVWEARTGTVLAELRGHITDLHSALSQDGKFMVTADSQNNAANVWEVGADKSVMERSVAELSGQRDAVYSAAISPDGKLVVTTGSDFMPQLWNVSTKQMIAELRGHTDRVNGALFSPDGQRIATASEDKTVRLWDAQTGQGLSEFRGHTAPVASAVFSPDGKFVATASADKTARLWLVPGFTVLQGHAEGGVHSAEFSCDGKLIVTASGDGTSRVWDASTGDRLALLASGKGDVKSAKFSPDGHFVVMASGPLAEVRDASTGKSVTKGPEHREQVTSAAFSPDGKFVVSVDVYAAKLWKAPPAAPDETRLEEDSTLSGQIRPVQSAAFSPDSKFVVAAGGQMAEVWDVSTGHILAGIRGHEGRVTSAQFSSDGKLLVTASEDKTARVWKVPTGDNLVLSGHVGIVRSAVFSPNDKLVVTGSDDKTARVWDVPTGRCLFELRGHRGIVRSAVFSPDGKFIVTASDDQTARVWDAMTGRSLSELRGHTDVVGSALFSPDSKSVVTASNDNTARLHPWESIAPLEDLMALAAARVTRQVTSEERQRFLHE